MRETKRRIPQFAFYDKTGIQTYLEKQAEQGWMLQKISFGWVFRRIEPGKLHFFVTYFPGKSVFEPDGSEKQKRFREFCEHTGWKLAATNEQMQIFYNEAKDPVPIETDAVMEVTKIHRSAGKSFLLPYGLLFLSFLVQVGMRIERMFYDPLNILEEDMDLLILFSWCLLAAYVLREIVRYFLWHRRAVRVAEAEGIFAPTKSVGKGWSMIPYFAIFCVVTGVVLLGDNGISRVFFIMLLMLTVSVAFITGISRWMRRIGVRAVFNRLAVIVLTVLVFLVTMQQLFLMLIRGELLPGREAAETYEYNGWTYEVYRDGLPLTLEDLFGEDEDSFGAWYSYELTEKESVFLVRSEARQDPRADAREAGEEMRKLLTDAQESGESAQNLRTDIQEPGEDAQALQADAEDSQEVTQKLPVLLYTVTQVKAPFLYDWCVRKTIEQYTGEENIDGEIRGEAMRSVEKEPWKADAAYRLYRGNEAVNEYVLCYGDLILELNTSWELTQEQMTVVGERIGGRITQNQLRG